jgi:hypothetical protein
MTEIMEQSQGDLRDTGNQDTGEMVDQINCQPETSSQLTASVPEVDTRIVGCENGLIAWKTTERATMPSLEAGFNEVKP